jgi:superfamily II DNA helicase RecQ
MAFQALPLLRNGIILVIAPLNQLMDQQAEALQASGILSIALTAERVDSGVYPRIVAGQYKVVFASPERTLAREGPLWQLITRKDSTFPEQLLYVVVDEAHLVFDWANSFSTCICQHSSTSALSSEVQNSHYCDDSNSQCREGKSAVEGAGI